MASITQQFLVPVSTVSTRNAWHNDLPMKFRGGYLQKNWVGVCCTLPETLTLFQTKICDFLYPIIIAYKALFIRREGNPADRVALARGLP